MDTASSFGMFVGLLLAYGLLRCFRTLWVDQVRHQLFCVRDDLFLYATDHGLLDHPAYRNLREMTNTFIRYAHVVSFVRIAGLTALAKLIPHEPPPSEIEYRKAAQTLSEVHRQRFDDVHIRIITGIFQHLYRSTLLLRLSHLLALPLLWIMGQEGGRPPAPSPTQAALVERDAFEKCAA